jgi:tRNA modification GTPase
VLHDTAGLREEGNRVERLGMERTRRAVSGADIVLQLREAAAGNAGGAPPGPGTQAVAPVQLPAGAVVLDVLTKGDLLTLAERERTRARDRAIMTSAVDGSGLQVLWRRLEAAAGLDDMKKAAELGVFLNERHQYRLMHCLEDVRELLQVGDDPSTGDEVLASLLAGILTGVEEISGRVFTEHLLDDVFSRFCVGK